MWAHVHASDGGRNIVSASCNLRFSMLLALVGCLVAGTSEAQEPDKPRLSVHGYLSQAYADSSEHQILGIPESGTTDYRTAAIQFAYTATRNDKVVIQVSHERFGLSPFRGRKDDIEIDWAFYERRFTDRTAIRVGKVQIPLGIFNEIRDVGTILPFYRPPFNFYGEGAFTSETVDGFVVSHRFANRGAWGSSLDVYYGGWDLLEIDPLTGAVGEGRAEDTIGGQLWIETPISGLRFGLGALRFRLDDEILAAESTESLSVWHGSIDGSFDVLTIRAEYLDVDLPIGSYKAYYGQAGLRLRDQFVINAQADYADLDVSAPLPIPGLPGFDGRFNRDLALGVNWEYTSNVVLKAETHWTKGYRIDEPVDLFFGPPLDARYSIVSISASF